MNLLKSYILSSAVVLGLCQPCVASLDEGVLELAEMSQKIALNSHDINAVHSLMLVSSGVNKAIDQEVFWNAFYEDYAGVFAEGIEQEGATSYDRLKDHYLAVKFHAENDLDVLDGMVKDYQIEWWEFPFGKAMMKPFLNNKDILERLYSKKNTSSFLAKGKAMIAGKYGYLEATEEEYLNYYEDQPCSYSTSNRMDFDWFRKQDDLPEAVSAFLLSKPTITDGWSLIDDGIRELWNQPGESWFFDRLVAASVNGFDGYVRSLPGVIGLIEDYSRRALPAALYLRSLGFQYKTLGYNMSPEHASQFIWNHRIPYTMNRTKLLGYEIQDGDEAV